MQFDYKHLVALGVGAVLAICGTYFRIDFSKSCPAVPAAVSAPMVSPAPAVK